MEINDKFSRFRFGVLDTLDEKYKALCDADAKMNAHIKLFECAYDVPGLDDDLYEKIKNAMDNCQDNRKECMTEYWAFRAGIEAMFKLDGVYTIDRDVDGKHSILRMVEEGL